jgi:integrase
MAYDSSYRRLKNGLGGEKPLWRHTAKLLRSYLRERRDVGPYLFTGRKGPCRSARCRNSLLIMLMLLASRRAQSMPCDTPWLCICWKPDAGLNMWLTTWGHKNIQNTRIYAHITHPLREQVFRELEQHLKIVQIS